MINEYDADILKVSTPNRVIDQKDRRSVERRIETIYKLDSLYKNKIHGVHSVPIFDYKCRSQYLHHFGART